MDSMPPALPPSGALLVSLVRGPLSDTADETLRRCRAFLFGMSRGGFLTKGLLHGYTERAHTDGAFLFSIAAGERSFGEWRELRALKPPRDPDLPDLLGRLTAFYERWLPRALAAAHALADEGDQGEARDYIGGDAERPSRTWTVKAFIQRLRGMDGIPFYQPVWDALMLDGLLDELPAVQGALSDIQDVIRNAPLDEAELADMQRSREDAASRLQQWLDDRKKELAPILHDEDATLLGLGGAIPPPFSGPTVHLVGRLQVAAKA